MKRLKVNQEFSTELPEQPVLLSKSPAAIRDYKIKMAAYNKAKKELEDEEARVKGLASFREKAANRVKPKGVDKRIVEKPEVEKPKPVITTTNTTEGDPTPEELAEVQKNNPKIDMDSSVKDEFRKEV